MIKEFLKKFPSLNMTVKPTQIQKLNNISDFLDSNIYCMRDDLTGFAFGGNKNRKLDYLVADAINRGADTLIAIGANQSNFCRMTAGAGVVNNLEVNLVLAGEKPEKATGNLLVDHFFAAKIKHIETSDDNVLLDEAKKLELQLNKEGKNVYNMPSGGSTKIGVLGYVDAFQEILDYEKSSGVNFDYIVLASGSGGTQAGLVLGKVLAKSEHEIIGISVGRSKDELEKVVYDLADQHKDSLSYNIDGNTVIADESYIGECYGARTRSGEEAVSLFARKEGILLDYVYTGKAAAGLIDYCKKGKFKKNSNILFIHTGGNIELFE